MITVRRLLFALAACAAVVIAGLAVAARPATAQNFPEAQNAPVARGTQPIRHVVVVGLSGLRWSQVTPNGAPALWKLADHGSVGALVDYAESPVACPADGWLTLNSGARAAAPRPADGQCAALPPVTRHGNGAEIPALPGLIAYNTRFDQDPDWGVLGRLAAAGATPSGRACATAVGPGAALALAAPDGAVRDYVPTPAEASAGVLARCPLTVVDLGQISSTERIIPTPAAHAFSRIVAELPPDTLLLLTAPGGASGSGAGGAGAPHLLTTVVSGPGFAAGLLSAASTRQPGIVTLTDLTPSVARWLGRQVPGYLVGSILTAGDRGSLVTAVRSLTATDTAEQVWMSTHAWFFAGYAVLDALLLGAPAVVFRGGTERNRRRRAACWRVTGTVAAAVPVSTFLASLTLWAGQEHPSVWLYGLCAGWTAVLAGLAFAGRWRRDPFGPPGVICLLTVVVLGIDVMTGSHLQLETPFGLSLLEAGRYYGLGNNAIGVFSVAALVAAAALSRRKGFVPAAAIALFAVVSSGWPGFGAKVGGTIAMVPCFAILGLELAGIRLRWRHAVPVAVSGLALVAVFALVSYLVPAVGVSDIGAFAGNLLHGQGGAVLERKANSNIGSLTVSVLSPLVPAGVVATGLALWRPGWFRLRTLPLAFKSLPLLRSTTWLVWLVLVIGWLVDDSGVIVPAAAAPFAVPLVVAMVASARDAGPARDIVVSPSTGLPSQVRSLRNVWSRLACSTSFRVLWRVPCCIRWRSANPG